MSGAARAPAAPADALAALATEALGAIRARGTFRRMRDNMDLNAGAIADGERTVEETGREILSLVLETASGRRTCAEELGHQEFVPWRIGPVL